MEKVYLILGASSDLGCALIKQLACENDEKITIIAHYYSSCEKLNEIDSLYSNLTLHIIQADLSVLSQTKEMIKKIQRMNVKLTHIVSLSADTFHHTRISEWDVDLINRDMNIQVYSLAEIFKAFLPEMAKNMYGKVVVMLTAYTFGVPPKNMAGYVTVKYALLGLMKSMASDFGDKGICVNGVSPGMVNTAFIAGIGRKIKEFTAQTNTRHRLLEVQDVIPMVCFLLSEKSEFINGSNINLSGQSE